MSFYHMFYYSTNVILNTAAMVVLAGTIIVTGLRNGPLANWRASRKLAGIEGPGPE